MQRRILLWDYTDVIGAYPFCISIGENQCIFTTLPRCHVKLSYIYESHHSRSLEPLYAFFNHFEICQVSVVMICCDETWHCQWWRHQMEKLSALLAICARNSPVIGEFPSQRPAIGSFDVFFDLHPSNQLSKQSLGWWFETPLRSLWRRCSTVSG